mgnify:FL=1|jgi:membrane-associated PAP2 superfamily phosphatase
MSVVIKENRGRFLSPQSTNSRHLLLLFCALIATILFFETTSADVVVQRWLFDAEIDSWIIDRDQPWLRFIFYDGVKKLYFGIVIIFSVLIFSPSLARFGLPVACAKSFDQQTLKVILVSLILIPLFVNGLKAVTNVPCPKDLALFGGNYPHITLFRGYPPEFLQQGPIRCYPAGHASGGFALMALSLLGKTRRAQTTIASAACVLGWVVGLYKMGIGDHFLGHTAVTMLIAMIVILLVDRSLRLRST